MSFTASQFHAWLIGFSEAVETSPTPEQWSRIKETWRQVEPDPVQAAPIVNVYREAPASTPANPDRLKHGEDLQPQHISLRAGRGYQPRPMPGDARPPKEL